MKTIYIIVSIVVSFLFLSCEKVIDLELKDSRPQIVVEGKLNNQKGHNYIILSRSGNFYDSNDFEKISNAIVSINDQEGRSYSLDEIEPGVYTDSTLTGQENNTYNLNIRVENQTITAHSTMPVLVPIDSLSVEIKDVGPGGGPNGGGPNGGEEPTYRLYCHFTDPAEVKNYYMLKASYSYSSPNGEETYTESFITNDDLFNGKSAKLGFRNFSVFKGDTLQVQLFSIDRANYEYYRLLEVNDMGAMSTSIGNPTSNVEGTDVIGVFGANAVDAKTIIVN